MLTSLYRDWGNELAPFDANNVIRPGYAEPTAPIRTVCQSPGVDVGSFGGVAVQKLADRLILTTQIQAAWYRYIPTWTFFYDGTFQPGWSFTAVANTCTSMAHYHNAYWRLDLDVDGAGNDVIDESNSGLWNSLTTETQRLASPASSRTWRVRDKVTGAGYELVPGADADVANADAVADVWALSFKPGELDDGGGTNEPDGSRAHMDQYVNGENIDGGNVVLWYRAGFRHEGQVDCEVAGPVLRPIATDVPALSIGDVSMSEGNTGTSSATFVVSLSAPSGNTVTVNYATAGGTATEGSDYTARAGVLTFLPGTTSQTLSVTVNGDTFVESTESFTVNLGGASNAFIGDGQGEGTIVNDDGATAVGLVAAYGLNEGSGLTTADATAGGHTGAITGAVWTTAGNFGSALLFDGIDDRVTVGSTPQLGLVAGTVQAWVRLDTLGRWHSVIAKGNANSEASHNYAIEIEQGNIVNCSIGNGTAFNVVRSTTQLAALQFYHLACTWDGSQLRLYINGVSSGSVAQTVTPAANSAPLLIGQFGGNVDRLDGVIDEVRIYSIALSQAQIQSDMNAPIEGGDPPTDSTPPTVTMTAPANNAFVGGTVPLSATASDNVGVASVLFLLDGQALGAADTTAPYSVSGTRRRPSPEHTCSPLEPSTWSATRRRPPRSTSSRTTSSRASPSAAPRAGRRSRGRSPSPPRRPIRAASPVCSSDWTGPTSARPTRRLHTAPPGRPPKR